MGIQEQDKDELQQKRMKHQLETQSWHIERVLARHQLSAQVSGGTARPGITRFDLLAQLENGWERLRDAAQEIRQVLGGPQVTLTEQDGRFRIQLEGPEEPLVSLLSLIELVPNWPGITTVLGSTQNREPLLMDFRDANTAHMLISGDPGTGKTSLLRTMALSMSLCYRQSQLQLFMIGDSEREETEWLLRPLHLLPHMLAPVGMHLDESTDILGFLVDELGYRHRHDIVSPAILLMIDEVVGLAEVGGGEVMEMITRLAQHGAGSGIHLAMTTRYPEAAHLDELLKSNLSVRVVGHVGNEQRIVAATGVSEPSVSYLADQGEFVAVIDGGEATQFQAAFVTDYDLHLSLNEMQRRRPRPILAQPISARDLDYADSDLDSRDAPAMRFVYDGQDVVLAHETIDSLYFRDDELVDEEARFEEE